MPDITDLLRSGAGEPVAPLDLDRVVARGAQRGRNRRVVQGALAGSLAAVGLVVAVTVAGDGTPRATGPDDYTTQLTAKDDVVPVDPQLDPRSRPKPAASTGLLPDGISFVLVKEVRDDHRVVVDKVDRALTVQKQAKCGQVDETYTYAEVFSFCWQNTNSLLRTATVADAVTQVQVPGGGDEPRTVDWAGFRALIAGGSADGEVTSTVWSVRVKDGVITSIAPAHVY